MPRFSQAVRHGPVVLTLTLVLATLAAAQTSRPASPAGATSRPAVTTPPAAAVLPEGEPAFEQAAAVAWRDDVLPLVERVAGRSFAAPPEVRIVDRDQLLESMVADGVLQLRALDPSIDATRKELELTLDLMMVAPALFGRYSIADGVIELPAGNVIPLMESAGIAHDRLPEVMTLVMAHELAHALHFQELDVPLQLESVRTSDGLKAWNAVTEGFGMLVQQQVARSRDLGPLNRQIVRAMGLGGSSSPAALAARKRYREIYRAGWDFLLAQSEQGGTERVWEVLAAPPVLYVQVTDPSRYGEPVEMTLNPVRLFRGLKTMLAPEGWADGVASSTSEEVARNYRTLGEETARAVAAAVRSAHTLMLRDHTSGSAALRTLTLFELSSEDAGAVLMDQMDGLRDERFVEMRRHGASQGLRIVDTEGAIDGLEATRSHLYRIALGAQDAPDDAPPLYGMTLAAAWRGTNAALLVVAGGGSPDDRTVAAAVDTLLERAESGAGMVPVVETDARDPLIAALKELEAVLPGDGWGGEHRQLDRPTAARLFGNDIAGRSIVETSFVSGAVGYVDRRDDGDRAQTMLALLLELDRADVAQAAMRPLLEGAEMIAQQAARFTNTEVDFREEPARRLGAAEVLGGSATVAQPGRPEVEMVVRIFRHGRFVARIVDFDGCLPADRLEAHLAAALGSLADGP